MKVLILKPSSLGDVVQALPVLRLIKKHRPESRVYWWLDSRLVPLLDGDPDLAGIVPFERDAFKAPGRWVSVWRSLRELRGHRFDWVIDLQALARSGIVAWLANGAFTIGLEDFREGAPVFYDGAVSRGSRWTHAVDWYLRVLPCLGVPVTTDFQWLPERPEAVSESQGRWQSEGRRWVVIQPGARWENKRWPVDHFARMVGRLSGEFPEMHFVVLGGREEATLGETIAAQGNGRCVNLAGRTGLQEMVEWVRGAELMVSNDTGPMHVAAALEKPVVALFGPTEPRRTGPYGQLDRVLRSDLSCVPCMKATCGRIPYQECLVSLSCEPVIDRVRRIWMGADSTGIEFEAEAGRR